MVGKPGRYLMIFVEHLRQSGIVPRWQCDVAGCDAELGNNCHLNHHSREQGQRRQLLVGGFGSTFMVDMKLICVIWSFLIMRTYENHNDCTKDRTTTTPGHGNPYADFDPCVWSVRSTTVVAPSCRVGRRLPYHDRAVLNGQRSGIVSGVKLSQL